MGRRPTGVADAPDLGPHEALVRARAAAKYRQIHLTGHAVDQMGDRNVQASDLRHAIVTATSAKWQADHGTWLLTGGRDTEGAGLTIAVAIEAAAVVVVTVF